MSSRFATGLLLAAAAATLSACMPPNAAQSPRPVTPEQGPKGSIHVSYVGGSFTRQIETRFRLDQAGYVLVGHLGGDGQIRVLYPETPRQLGWVRGGETVVIKPHSAMFDVSPHLFSFASAPWRSMSAQLDSYDGMGHGYVFMITSRYPIDYEAIADRAGFEALEIEDYETTRDPRYAIRNLADALSTGAYTLKFARNHSGSAYARATGCGSRWGLSSFGFDHYDNAWMDLGYSFFNYPGISLLSGIQFARLYGMRSCRGSFYASHRYYYPGIGRTVTIPQTGTPQGPLTPRLQRPTRRTLEDQGRSAVISGRSGIDRRGTLSTRSASDGGRRAIRPSAGRPERIGETGRSRPTSTEVHRPARSSRPDDGPRMSTPSAPRPSTTVTAPATPPSGGGEAKAPRPPRP